MVRVERVGGITTVILDRPAAKNAVDRDTAEQLAAAFRAFDADASSPVAVLYGDHGTFCAGADLKALAIGLVNRVVPAGESRAAAEQLARELAALPQAALRADRTSAYLQHDLDLPAALQQELELGSRALAEAVQGAARFAGGAGRHGGRA